MQELVRLRRSLNINDYSSQGFTPLATAIVCKRIDIAKCFLDLDADVHQGYKDEWRLAKEPWLKARLPFVTEVATPLSLAATVGSSDLVELLSNHSADVKT